MVRSIAAFALSLLVVLALSVAHAQDAPQGIRIHGGYVSGTEYLDMSAQQREAYVAGLLEGTSLAPNFGAPPARLEWLIGCTAVLDRPALAERIYDYIFKNTKLWDNRNPAKMYRAVADACRAAAQGARTGAAKPFTVRDYVSMGGHAKKAFVSGLLEGMLLAPAFGGEESRMDWFLRCTIGLDRIAMRGKVNQYIMAHSERWTETAAQPYFRAIADACTEWANQQPQNSKR